MITHTDHAYNGASDLAKLQVFTAQNTLQYGDCGQLHVGDIPHALYNGLRKFDPARVCQLWEDDAGNLLGWAFVWPKKSAHFELYVRHNLWHTDLPSEILHWAESSVVALLRESNPQADSFSLYPEAMDCDTAKQRLYEAHGYTLATPTLIYTTRSLSAPIPEARLPEGFTIRCAAGDHEAGKLAAVHHGAFNSGWTEDEYRTLMHTPGYNHEYEMVVVAPDGTFAAFTVLWVDWLNKTMLFEPVGTHKDFQRRGLGRALMNAAMRRMKAEGIKTAIVLHEADNPASSGLYATLGFEPKYRILSYTKQVKR